MSYESYFLSEAKLAGVSKTDQELVLKMLKPISDEGHSGGSMSVFIQWLEDWANNPQPITDKRSMLYPVQESVKGLSYDDLKRIAGYVYKTCAFEPFTPLTGKDDEWIECHDGWFQNRRFSKVFKHGVDGTPYSLDRVIWCYPYHDYFGWGACTRGGGYSSADITFPYDPALPENAPKYRYFLDDDWNEELPDEIDPKVWIKWQKARFCNGVNPGTGKLRKNAVCLGEYTVEELSDAYREVMQYIENRTTRENSVEEAIQSLSYVYSDDEETHRFWGLARIQHEDLANRLIYLLSSKPTAGEYCIASAPILTPGRFYQRWNKTQDVWFGWVQVDKESQPIYIEDDIRVTGDYDDYLYSKRRQYGYPHPNRKTRVTGPNEATINLPEPEGDSPANPDPA